MNKIEIISNKPLVFKHTAETYKEINLNLLEYLGKYNSVPFEFENNKGELIAEKYRRIYPIYDIFTKKEIQSNLKIIAQAVVPEFLKKLKHEINGDDYSFDQNITLKYCLRIRVLEDIKGYSLQPHKDSEDTIFSFILQLNNNNTRTTTYNKGRQFKLNGNFSDCPDVLHKQVASVINKICPGEKLFMGESQFRKNIGMWTNDKFFRFEKIKDFVGLQEFNETVLNVGENSLYGISNSLMNYIRSHKLEEANLSNYHGVRPIQQESRKLMIMDLLAQPTKDDVLMMKGVNNDKNSYYLIYSPQKCQELNNLLL
jgi:hypothetical protein